MTPVTVSSVSLETSDGASLAASVYSGAGPTDVTVVMLPGIGVPRRAFRHLASWLAERGLRCLTVDYRGMGDSASRENIASATLMNWARQDAVAALRYAEATWQQPVAHVGHSFGGQLVGLVDELHRVCASVFICSQLGQTRYWDGFPRVVLTWYWYVGLPVAAALFDVLPRWSGLGKYLPRGVAREWARWGRSREWYLSHDRDAARRLRGFPAPILAFGVSDDEIAPPRAVTALLEKFEATTPTHRQLETPKLGLERLGHVGLLRPMPQTLFVWEQILEFLRMRRD